MGGERRYRTAVEKALFVLSRGTCYAPTCKNPVVTIEDGEPRVEVFIAHIRAAKRDGPRYDESMTELARRSFPNLVLLCKRHSDKVDGKKTCHLYPSETLHEWKTEREKPFVDQLAGLSGLTEDRLKGLLSEAAASFRDEVMEGLNKVQGLSREVVEILKSIVDEPFSRPVVDPDTLNSLENSASTLLILQDYAPMLSDSARSIESLVDTAHALYTFRDAVDKLEDLNLYGSSDVLTGMNPQISRFSNAVETLQLLDLSSLETTVASVARSTASPPARGTARASPVRPVVKRAPETRHVDVRVPIANGSWFRRHKVLAGMCIGAVVILAVQALGIGLMLKLNLP